MKLRVNVGCGRTPTRGWRNFDNSLSLRLSTVPLLPNFLRKLRLIDRSQYEFIRFSRDNDIEYRDATKDLALRDESVDVLYSSHMLEHLDRQEADRFLAEAFRVLRPGGILRIAVPDMKKQVQQYIESGDLDALIESTLLCVPRPKSLAQRLRHLVVGIRNHQWMYDDNSLSHLLQKHGFGKTEVVPAGRTRIPCHEPLDLHERASESVYVEGEKPLRQGHLE